MAGRKVWTREVLTSADVQNYLMDQTVPRFASASVRTAQWSAPTEGALSYLEDVNRYEKRTDAGTWVPLIGDRTIGDAGSVAGAILITGTPGWTDIATVTGASTGLPCVARWSGVLFNGGSGADRLCSWRVACDGADIGSLTGINVINTGSPRSTKYGAPRSTPAAGSHTWILQANAAVASAVYADAGRLEVVEVAA